MCACVSSQHRRDLLKFATRFGTFSAARYLANLAVGITMTQLTGCNGDGGGFSSPTPNVLSFTSITSNPTALKPVYLKASGFVSTDFFTLSLLDEYGNPLISLFPIRVGSDGTIVVSLPLNFSGVTGATSGYNCCLSLTQNGTTTISSVIAVADLPDASVYGMSLGWASHDLYIFAEISLGRTLNTLQALSLTLTPGISIDLTAITQRIQIMPMSMQWVLVALRAPPFQLALLRRR